MIEPYYSQDGKCRCGCGLPVNRGRKYVSGHNLAGLKRTPEHNAKIGLAQKHAWSTKRERLPIGTRYLDRDGYVRVKVVKGKGAWKLEHVMAMEAAIGRPLVAGEIVHHINGDRSDNRIANLYLCESRSHHNAIHGQLDEVVRCLVNQGVIEFKDGTYKAVL